jgi:hypothetical protein
MFYVMLFGVAKIANKLFFRHPGIVVGYSKFGTSQSSLLLEMVLWEFVLWEFTSFNQRVRSFNQIRCHVTYINKGKT